MENSFGTYQHKNWQGSMFPYDKEGNENRPDFRGIIMINNEKYIISAWKNVTITSEIPYMSLNLSKYRPSKSEGDVNGFE